MICPFRFKEFTSEPSMQECQKDCAWITMIDGHYTCAITMLAAVLARSGSVLINVPYETWEVPDERGD